MSSCADDERWLEAAEQLIVFARFPEPGRAKTRLIPALGAERAAQLQSALTRATLTVARETRRDRSCGLHVRFDGGGSSQMREMFGTDVRYDTQRGNDLGDRLQHAVSAAIAHGAARVVVIGTDCPEITSGLLGGAFEALRHADVVLGPALDGGYYLIGLRAECSSLFQGIAWGTEHVFRQTMDAARRMACVVHQLQPLSDVDYPEDLLVCRRLKGELAEALPPPRPGLLSVIIPTLNEERSLEQTLLPVLGLRDVEVIVADGGSTDNTVEIARRLGAVVVPARAGRGRQMNAGAALARGEILLFLHADTSLPQRFAQLVRSTLDTGAVAGAFRLRINGHRWPLRWIEWGANLRSSQFDMPYGDQGLFLRAETFYRVRGFELWPLMEDYDLCRRLRRRGRIRIAPACVTTSARRWNKLGAFRAVLRNQFCIAGFHLGVPPDRLAKWYRSRSPSATPESSGRHAGR